MAKLTFTLQNEQLDQIRALVAAGETGSLSGFVQHAVAIALHDAAEWREMLADAIEQTGGPLTKTERAWADALLATPKQKRGPRKGRPA